MEGCITYFVTKFLYTLEGNISPLDTNFVELLNRKINYLLKILISFVITNYILILLLLPATRMKLQKNIREKKYTKKIYNWQTLLVCATLLKSKIHLTKKSNILYRSLTTTILINTFG